MQNTKRPEMVGADVEKIFQGIAEGCLMVRFAARSAHMKSWKNISGGRRGQASGAPSSEMAVIFIRVHCSCTKSPTMCRRPAGLRQS